MRNGEEGWKVDIGGGEREGSKSVGGGLREVDDAGRGEKCAWRVGNFASLGEAMSVEVANVPS